MSVLKTPSSATPLIILLVGSTGCGKSTFVNAVVGKDVAPVGQGLDSVTCKVTPYDFVMPKDARKLRLVDTPGFNNSAKDGSNSDAEILQATIDFLEKECAAECELGGVLFFRNINTAPVSWKEQQRNMVLFEKLLPGNGVLEHVNVITTSTHCPTGAVSHAEDEVVRRLLAGGAHSLCSDFLDDGAHLDCGMVLSPHEILAHVLGSDQGRNHDGVHLDCEVALSIGEVLAHVSGSDQDRNDDRTNADLAVANEDACTYESPVVEARLESYDDQILSPTGDVGHDDFFGLTSKRPVPTEEALQSMDKPGMSGKMVAIFKESSRIEISGGVFNNAGNDIHHHQTDQQVFYLSTPIPPSPQQQGSGKESRSMWTMALLYMGLGVAVVVIPTIILGRVRK